MLLKVYCLRKSLPCLKSSNIGGAFPPPNSTFRPRAPFRGAFGFSLSSHPLGLGSELLGRVMFVSCPSRTAVSQGPPSFLVQPAASCLLCTGLQMGWGFKVIPRARSPREDDLFTLTGTAACSVGGCRNLSTQLDRHRVAYLAYLSCWPGVSRP